MAYVSIIIDDGAKLIAERRPSGRGVAVEFESPAGTVSLLFTFAQAAEVARQLHTLAAQDIAA